MKKIIALALCALFIFSLASCRHGDATQTTGTETTSPVDKNIEIENGVLKACIGQADKNGVYNVPDGITMIGEMCFAGDVTLKKVVLPDGVTTIGSGAFSGCTELSEIVLPDTVKTLGAYAFYGCASIEAIELPTSLYVIGSSCFYGCTSLEKINVSESVEKINHDAFAYCISLETASFPSTLEEIDYNAFYACTSLTELDFSACRRLKTIGASAFAGCSMLKKAVLPEKLKTISDNAFYECSALSSVTVPSTVSSIGPYAFNYTPWYAENTDDYLIVGDGVLIKCNVKPKQIDLSGKGIKVIGATSFWNDKAALNTSESRYGYKYADQLTSITIPEGVTVIQTAAFYYCMALTEVILPSTLTAVEASAFDMSYSETTDTEYYAAIKIDLSPCTKLESIGAKAFYGCSETNEIIIADTVKYVGLDAFCMTAAYKSFFADAAKKSDASYKVINGVLLWTYVPDGVTSIEIPDGVRIVGGGACGGWDNAVIATDPSLLSPYWKSKYNITNKVASLVISEGVKTICDYGFYYLGKISSVTIPDSVERIGYLSFGRLVSLTSLSVSGNLKELGNAAFWMCSSLSSVILPDSLETVGSDAFSGCASLKSVSLPKNAKSVGTSIFSSECISLTHVYMTPELRPEIYDILGNVSSEIKISYYND